MNVNDLPGCMGNFFVLILKPPFKNWLSSLKKSSMTLKPNKSATLLTTPSNSCNSRKKPSLNALKSFIWNKHLKNVSPQLWPCKKTCKCSLLKPWPKTLNQPSWPCQISWTNYQKLWPLVVLHNKLWLTSKIKSAQSSKDSFKLLSPQNARNLFNN